MIPSLSVTLQTTISDSLRLGPLYPWPMDTGTWTFLLRQHYRPCNGHHNLCTCETQDLASRSSFLISTTSPRSENYILPVNKRNKEQYPPNHSFFNQLYHTISLYNFQIHIPFWKSSKSPLLRIDHFCLCSIFWLSPEISLSSRSMVLLIHLRTMIHCGLLTIPKYITYQ